MITSRFNSLILGMSLLLIAFSTLAQDPPGQMIQLDGNNLHLYCEGQGEDTILIDLGAGSWSLDALPVQKALIGRGYKVCAWDRPGLGFSDAGSSPPTSEFFVASMKQLIEHSDLEAPLIVAGHSFGGQNVRLFASTYPSLVKAVILVDSGHEDQWKQFDPIIWEAVAGQAQFSTSLADALRAGVSAPAPAPESDESLPKKWQVAVNQVFNNPRHFDSIAQELLNIPTSNEQLAASDDLGDIPLLVLTAERSFYAYDGLIPTNTEIANNTWLELQNELVDLSIRSTQVVAPNVDHRLLQMNPELVANHIDEFLRSNL